MAVTTHITERLTAIDPKASPVTGAGIVTINRDTTIPSGTAAGQADLVTKVSLTVAGSGNVDWDARAAIQAGSGAACNGAELAYLRIEIPSTASGNVTVKVGASNGLDILSGTTDGIVLRPGAKITIDFLEAVGPAMDASNRIVNLANGGASDTVATITCLQRSA